MKTTLPKPTGRNAPTTAARVAALLLAAGSVIGAHAQAPGTDRTETLALAGHRLVAEVADTDAARLRGLMYRTRLAPDHGMLFVFDQPDEYCMWMRNTRLPLSVAFLDARGAVINVEVMQPQTDDRHCARRPASYALEMTQGWFSAHGIREGAVLSGMSGVRHSPPHIPN